MSNCFEATRACSSGNFLRIRYYSHVSISKSGVIYGPFVPSAIRQYVVQQENASDFDPRKIYKVARDAMQALCQSRYEAFGSAGHASKIKAIPLAKMVKRY